MATSTRPPLNSPPVSGHGFNRKPLKKSSFLSLKKDRKSFDSLVSPTLSQNDTAFQSGSGTPPSSFTVDAGASSRPSISRSMDPKGNRSRSASRGGGGSLKEGRSHGSKSREKSGQLRSPPLDSESFDFPDSPGESIPWPATDDVESLHEIRRRVLSGSSKKHPWEQQAFSSRPLKYPYRDSGSSTLSQFEPLPQTPVDDMFSRRMFSIPIVVAAPIAGVETMDALVDGMNGSSEDDQFGSSSLSSRGHFKKTGHHPLYHPPLPKPPPGVTLGLPRKGKQHSDSESDDNSPRRSSKHSRKDRDKSHRPRSSRTPSNITVTRYPTFDMPTVSTSSSRTSLASNGDTSFTDSVSDHTPSPRTALPPQSRPSTAPSIDEIIKTHAPQVARATLSRRTSWISQTHSARHEDSPRHPPPSTFEPDADLVSRSSVDTIAEEIRQTMLNQRTSAVTSSADIIQSRPPTIGSRPRSSAIEHPRSPISDGRCNSSLFDSSTVSDQSPLPPMDISQLTKAPIHSTSQTIAQYLRSSRLTSNLKLIRSPHASRDSPLNVSFSDLGSATGVPLLVFLGLGCVRHIMGLYDEMADLLGIRLITIDRWGLGKTDSPRSKAARGIPEWATVVEEVLDILQIDQCSIMAHSAGAPYALAFASRFPERIRGDLCLLAPWVGGGENTGYKWLKYVPNGILKTAQAAEWKMQAWMLGKPPTIAYQGIGFDVKAACGPQSSQSPLLLSPQSGASDAPFSPTADDHEGRSSGSGGFSDYDDLRDFDGRFESRSTLGRRSTNSQRSRVFSENKSSRNATRKPSKGFLGRFKSGSTTPSQPEPAPPERSQSLSGKRLKGLRSMSSLKGRPSTAPGGKKSSAPPSSMPRLPQTEIYDTGLGIDEFGWPTTVSDVKMKSNTIGPSTRSVKSEALSSLDLTVDSPISFPRSSGRRSVSFGASMARPRVPAPPVPSLPPLPGTPLPTSPTLASPGPSSPLPETPGGSYQAALGNALIAASHAESSKGTHSDLVQILNHDRQPWGFSYANYPHTVRVWYGDKDERIAENAVRWMETTMGQDRCQVKVVKGADHALMFRSGVVVEVLEYISECWHPD